MNGPRNRSQRRAAAATAKRAGSESTNTTDEKASDPAFVHSIPLRSPQSSSSSAKPTNNPKTLYDIIAERQQELLGAASPTSGPRPGYDPRPPQPATHFATIDVGTGRMSRFEDGPAPGGPEQCSRQPQRESPRPENGADGEGRLPPAIDTLLLSVPLTALHLTLAYLAAHQYAQAVELGKLVRESALVAFPVLSLLVHLAHGHVVSWGPWSSRRAARSESTSDSRREQRGDSFGIRFAASGSWVRRSSFPPSWRTVVFLPLAVVLGARLVAITNEAPYYAVVKRAPAVGTLWVWCILELSLEAAVVGALGPLLWAVLWKDYGIY